MLVIKSNVFIFLFFDKGRSLFKVFMDLTSPIPPIACNWRNYQYQCAQGWEIPYVPRIEAFRSLLWTNSDVTTQETIDLDET